MELFGVTAWQKKTSSRVLGSRWVSGDMPQELEEGQGQLGWSAQGEASPSSSCSGSSP